MTLLMVSRVDLIGMTEAEPVTVDVHPDGFVDLILDDGLLLQLDPENVAVLRGVLGRALAARKDAA